MPVPAGAVLETGFARIGARAYLAVAGGIETAPVLGSRSTFHMAGVGGMEGHAIEDGQRLPLGDGTGNGTPGRRVKEDCRPPIPEEKSWQIESSPALMTTGSDEAGQRMFLESDWTLQARSNRTGYRLTGPEWTFAARATDRGPSTASIPPTSWTTVIPWAR